MTARTTKIVLIAAAMVGVLAPLVNANAPAGRYVISNGTVKDTKTGLTWQQQFKGDTCWPDAVSYCSAQSGGWRLPTGKELLTIFDYSASMSPAIDLTAFPNTPATTMEGMFWSSTHPGGDANSALEVSFASYPFGNVLKQVGLEEGTCSQSARCVR